MPVKATRQQLVLASALVLIEFVAGIASYLTNGIFPQIAGSLHDQSLYGWATASTQAAVFAAMPLGPALTHHWRASRVLIALTVISTLGSLVSAAAPNAWTFCLGCALRGLAAGALSAVSMGIVGVALGEQLRHLVMSFMSVSWLLAGFLGPLYAVGVSSLCGWRWSMVLYLPVLLIARVVIGRAMGHSHDQSLRGGQAPRTALVAVLVAGAVCMGISGPTWTLVIVAAGALITIAVLSRMLGPAGPRKRTLVGFATVSGVYYAASAPVGTIIHLAFGAPARTAATGLAVCGVSRAGLGVVMARSKPRTRETLLRRSIAGWTGLLLGLAAAGATCMIGRAALSCYLAALVLLGAGMALLYADTFGIVFADHHDGSTESEIGARVALAEAAGGAIGMELAYTMIGTRWAGLTPTNVATATAVYAALCLTWITAGHLMTTSRAAAFQ